MKEKHSGINRRDFIRKIICSGAGGAVALSGLHLLAEAKEET